MYLILYRMQETQSETLVVFIFHDPKLITADPDVVKVQYYSFCLILLYTS